jgi:hypothetical protein
VLLSSTSQQLPPLPGTPSQVEWERGLVVTFLTTAAAILTGLLAYFLAPPIARLFIKATSNVPAICNSRVLWATGSLPSL